MILASLIIQTIFRPNVIYIMADELGYWEPGFMGGRNIQTPNPDRMTAEGIRFDNLPAGSAVCAPTRRSRNSASATARSASSANDVFRGRRGF